ncbi:MAG: asparaginase [Pseudanabaenaceae cyanobacterium SKYGB_i_bin29]|nr:asparaginase [Pseudanabaenaceae cyanobacterium SKYG29]MDW8421254.1 asparaginase [Pseudanabaenaceae cyanobacterium SKYGB_i_bin29]
MSRRPRSAPLVVRLLREGITESIHYCDVAVADHRGRIIAAAGDFEHPIFARSCLKPIQALPVVTTGTLDRFHLNDRHLALMCGSHQGTIEQSRLVFHILWQCDVEPEYLKCPKGDRDSSLQHNCSGKHAGMLAVCRQQNWDIATYTDRDHPVQQLIREKLGELLHMPPAELVYAHDDCTAPTYLLEIGQLASLYAFLSGYEHLHLERIARAMTTYPELVAGKGEFDTEVMTVTGGTILSKSGAEGLQCLGKIAEGLGIAIKVADGSKRAKQAVAIYVLRQLGWVESAITDQLADTFARVGEFSRLEVEGELT